MGISMTCCSTTEEKLTEKEPIDKSNNEHTSASIPLVLSYPTVQDNRHYLPRSISSTTIQPVR
jgi:hypothetical protein